INLRPRPAELQLPCEGEPGDLLAISHDDAPLVGASLWFCVKGGSNHVNPAVWVRLAYDYTLTCGNEVPLPPQEGRGDPVSGGHALSTWPNRAESVHAVLTPPWRSGSPPDKPCGPAPTMSAVTGETDGQHAQGDLPIPEQIRLDQGVRLMTSAPNLSDCVCWSKSLKIELTG